LKIQDDLNHHRKFPMTAAQTARVESLLNESDSVRFFVVNCIKRSPLIADTVTSDDLFDAYCQLCNANGWNMENETKFARRAKDLMTQIHSAGYSKHLNREGKFGIGQRGYTNVQLIDLESVHMPKSITDDDGQDEFGFPDSETDHQPLETTEDENFNPF
jgi:hypothetical protein